MHISFSQNVEFRKPPVAKTSMERHGPWRYGLCMDLKFEMGRRLRAAREQRRLTLREVCEQVPGLIETRLHNWEAGKRGLPVEMAKVLAPILGVTAGYLLTLTDEPGDDREGRLLGYYRHSDGRGKESIFRVAEIESGYSREGNS